MHVLWSIRNAVGCQSRRKYSSNSINDLVAAFKDPSSPFYLPSGQKGPESPEPPKTQVNTSLTGSDESKLKDAYKKLTAAGYDPASFWQQPIAWGDADSFQHVNNARYATFFESGLQRWMLSLGNELGGPAKAEALIKGRGISLIMKSIEMQFRRPVTFPDTLLIGSRPCLPDGDLKDDPTTLQVVASAYSLAQGAFVTYAKRTMVWYDYDRLKKCDPGEQVREAVQRRMKRD